MSASTQLVGTGRPCLKGVTSPFHRVSRVRSGRERLGGGHLRLAAGAAASRYVGNDALRLLRAAADTAIGIGGRGGAALDLAWMSIYIDRCPGIIADGRTADEAAALRYEARAIAVSSTMLSNTAAQPYDLRNGDPAVFESTRHAVTSPIASATRSSRVRPSTR